MAARHTQGILTLDSAAILNKGATAKGEFGVESEKTSKPSWPWWIWIIVVLFPIPFSPWWLGVICAAVFVALIVWLKPDEDPQ